MKPVTVDLTLLSIARIVSLLKITLGNIQQPLQNLRFGTMYLEKPKAKHEKAISYSYT